MTASMMKVDVVRAACCVAGADGAPNDKERQLVEKLAGEIGIGKASLDAMLDRAERDREFYREQFRNISHDAVEVMRTLVCVALVDGDISDAEQEVLGGLAGQLDMNESDFKQLMEQATRYQSSLQTTA